MEDYLSGSDRGKISQPISVIMCVIKRDSKKSKYSTATVRYGTGTVENLIF